MIPGSKEIFAMTCAATEWPHGSTTKDELIGAAVFDMVHGMLVGTIKSRDTHVYDLKFAYNSYSWVDKLEKRLNALDKSIKFKKIDPDKSSEVNKRYTKHMVLPP